MCALALALRDDGWHSTVGCGVLYSRGYVAGRQLFGSSHRFDIVCPCVRFVGI